MIINLENLGRTEYILGRGQYTSVALLYYKWRPSTLYTTAQTQVPKLSMSTDLTIPPSMEAPGADIQALIQRLRLHRPRPSPYAAAAAPSPDAAAPPAELLFRPRRAAVLICLFRGAAGELRVLLTKRSSKLSSHSGELSSVSSIPIFFLLLLDMIDRSDTLGKVRSL